MKFLYFTDSHWRSDRPRYRTDDVYKSQFEELSEIANLVIEHDIEFIVHGGDAFHSPKPSHELVRDLISWAKYVNVPIYVLPGNHDLIGYNPESISSVGLGVLFESEMFKPLTELEFNDVGNDEHLYIRGVLPEVTPHNDKYVLGKKWENYTCIIVSHNYISPTSLRFPYLPTQNVKTDANLFLLGHLHEPSDVEMNGTRFVNPGALSRWNINDFERVPTVLLVEVENADIKIQHIPLSCAKKGSEIFDLQSVSNEKIKEDQLASFMNSLQSTNFETNDVEALVMQAGKDQGIEERILTKSLEMIKNAKENLR